MKREEIEIYEDKIKDYICFRYMDVSPDISELSDIIVDECVLMIPDDSSQQFITLNPKPASFKTKNICIDFKQAIVKTLGWIAGTNEPDTVIHAIKAVLSTVLWVINLLKVEITDDQADFIYWLHKNNLYGVYKKEEDMIVEYQEYFLAEKGRKVDKSLVQETINSLYKIKCLDIVNGNIRLCEKVWGSR